MLTPKQFRLPGGRLSVVPVGCYRNLFTIRHALSPLVRIGQRPQAGPPKVSQADGYPVQADRRREGRPGFTIADPDDRGMMDVVGFDTAAPQLMSDFVLA